MNTDADAAEMLAVASERRGYALVDEISFLRLQSGVNLEVLVSGERAVKNRFGVIPVAGASNPEGAQTLATWITSGEAQAIIGAFGVDEFGEAVFDPAR